MSSAARVQREPQEDYCHVVYYGWHGPKGVGKEPVRWLGMCRMLTTMGSCCRLSLSRAAVADRGGERRADRYTARDQGQRESGGVDARWYRGTLPSWSLSAGGGGVGGGSGFSDAEYQAAGAELAATHDEVFARAELIVKVKEPIAAGYPLLRAGQLLFTYLHLAADEALARALLTSGVTAIAYETVQLPGAVPRISTFALSNGTLPYILQLAAKGLVAAVGQDVALAKG